MKLTRLALPLLVLLLPVGAEAQENVVRNTLLTVPAGFRFQHAFGDSFNWQRCAQGRQAGVDPAGLFALFSGLQQGYRYGFNYQAGERFYFDNFTYLTLPYQVWGADIDTPEFRGNVQGRNRTVAALHWSDAHEYVRLSDTDKSRYSEYWCVDGAGQLRATAVHDRRTTKEGGFLGFGAKVAIHGADLRLAIVGTWPVGELKAVNPSQARGEARSLALTKDRPDAPGVSTIPAFSRYDLETVTVVERVPTRVFESSADLRDYYDGKSVVYQKSSRISFYLGLHIRREIYTDNRAGSGAGSRFYEAILVSSRGPTYDLSDDNTRDFIGSVLGHEYVASDDAMTRQVGGYSGFIAESELEGEGLDEFAEIACSNMMEADCSANGDLEMVDLTPIPELSGMCPVGYVTAVPTLYDGVYGVDSNLTTNNVNRLKRWSSTPEENQDISSVKGDSRVIPLGKRDAAGRETLCVLLTNDERETIRSGDRGSITVPAAKDVVDCIRFGVCPARTDSLPPLPRRRGRGG